MHSTASRACIRFELDDVHLPFAGEAVTRSGHPLPPETRNAYRDVDAILVASPHEPAFDGVKADLRSPGASRACSSASPPTSS